MERLLADAQKISGVEYNIDNLGDVYSAIHVIQGELGLTGVAAQEASTTFSGSFAAMKAAAANLLGNLALGENVGPSMQALIATVSTFLTGNLIPMIGNVLKTLPSAIGTAVSTGGPVVMNAGKKLLNGIISAITTGLPNVLDKASAIVTNVKQGIQNGLPSVIEQGSQILDSLLNAISVALPLVLEKGGEILSNVISGITEAIPQLGAVASTVINKIGEFLANNLPTIAEKGGELLGTLAGSMIRSLPTIVTTVGKLTQTIIKNIVKVAPKMLQAGVNLIKGLASGIGGSVIGKVNAAMGKIKNALTGPINSAKNTIAGIMNKIKSIFPLSIGKIFDNIKLPHISVSAGKPPFGIAGMGELPQFHVQWYAKAAKQPYLFDNPTLFGAGDVKDEMLYGRANLLRDIREATRSTGTTNTFNFYVSGAENPEAWANRAMRQLKMEVRMA